MALSEPLSTPLAEIASRSRLRRSLFGGGTAGNEQLTAVVGLILLALFAVLGIAILFIGSGKMLWLDLFVGTLLVGPVAAAYKRKGPPHPPLACSSPGCY